MLKRSLHLTLLITTLLLTHLCSHAQKPAATYTPPETWSQDYAPFRIAGNLYYVGSYELACYLITTPKGHILINTGMPGSAPMIRKHVEALGFKFSDIKILLTNQAHADHVGAMAAIKKITGAKMMINEKDAPVLADGGRSDYALGGNPAFEYTPVKANRLLHDKDTVTLGGMQVIVLHHPGHTKGSSSFLVTVNDTLHTYKVLIANMPSVLEETNLAGMPAYPDVAKDYAYTFDAMKKLEFDLWFAAHAGQFDLHKKRKPGDAYNPAAFIDRPGYDSILSDLQKAYLKKLGSAGH
ncbi:subclass B3 metallo-beta-lactamase [Chitinophaga sp. GbtcB8]|uniref:subclass B3 metallo-beta-lactamase n=1 Tax=Chitinophaga sp. GbtcB8 TaxID=2824753 RepID=UPI001C2F2832|nr:subclass B3 metallo-beta-lactamase [Chitinophaga sp. GbtcB8]